VTLTPEPRPGRTTFAADPDVVATIEQAVRAGAPISDACQRAGIHRGTWHAWMNRGRAERARLDTNPDNTPEHDERHYLNFYDTMTRAEAEAKIEAIAVLRRALRGWDEQETITVTKDVPTVVIRPDGTQETVMVAQRTVTVREGRKFAWQAAIVWLERKYPGEWARLVKTIDEAPDEPLSVDAARARALEVVDQVAARRRQREIAAGTEHASEGNGQ